MTNYCPPCMSRRTWVGVQRGSIGRADVRYWLVQTAVARASLSLCAHSARSTTAEINPRTGLVEAGITYHSNRAREADEVVELVRGSEHWVWEVASVSRTVWGVPLVAVVNRTGADRRGLSEITPGLSRLSTPHAFAGDGSNREFFSTPQRYGIGPSEENFEGVDSWKLISPYVAGSSMRRRAPSRSRRVRPSPGPF